MANGVTPRLTLGTEARAARVDLSLPPRTRKRSLTTAADPPAAVRLLTQRGDPRRPTAPRAEKHLLRV